MAIVVDAGDGRLIEFPDEATANSFFASQGGQQATEEEGRAVSYTHLTLPTMS